MIEEIARAIYKATWGENDFPTGCDYERLEAIAQARAAIESIADLDPRIWIDACHDAGIALEDGEMFWRAAIRAILNETSVKPLSPDVPDVDLFPIDGRIDPR